MTLVLTLEHAPSPQARMEIRHESGDLVIGRNADVDWQIDDPEMYVSRKHCLISGSDGQYTVTDSSRGGLFVDGSSTPLGAGNSLPLEEGMRLRMGDYVVKVGLGAPAKAAPREAVRTIPPSGPPAGGTTDLDDDPFFSVSTPPREPQKTPENKPPAFETGARDSFFGDEVKEEKSQAKPFFDDTFTLDPVDQRTVKSDPSGDLDFDFGPRTAPPVEPERAEPVAAPEPKPQPAPEPPAPVLSAKGEREAFFRGMGLDPKDFADMDPVAQMEAMGARYRMLVDGLLHLLRTRAKEKQDARIAQTIIGNVDVNPLKFAVTTDDAVEALVHHRGQGYLEPDPAITDAFRDLAEHHIKSWNGVQTSLRRMIDKFDPAEFEREMDDASLIETLFAGGRSAKLWQLYAEKYKQMARSAEDRFLGEVGADFRDAYESTKG